MDHPSFSEEPVPFYLIPKPSNPDSLEAAITAAAAFLDKAVKPVLVGGVKLRQGKAQVEAWPAHVPHRLPHKQHQMASHPVHISVCSKASSNPASAAHLGILVVCSLQRVCAESSMSRARMARPATCAGPFA